MIKKYYKKYLSIPIAARAALWFVICTLLQRCISFFTVPIFTRLMPTEEYGLYSTYLSVYSVALTICTLSMEKCVYINGLAKSNSEEEKDESAVSLLSLSEVITLIIFFLYLICRDFVNALVGLPTVLMCLIFAQILFDPPVIFWSTKQRYTFKYVKLVALTIGMVIANSIFGILFVMLSKTNQAIFRVLSIVVVQIIIGGICYFYFFRRAHILFKCKGWKKAISLQLPLLPHSISLTILSSSDRIMINSMVGATQAAIYSVAYSCGYVVTTFKNSIVSAMTPWIYEKIKNQDYKSIREIVKPILLFITLITFMFIAFAPEIVMILAPKEYHEAIYVIPPVAASSYFTFLYNMFSNVSFYYEETKKIMYASLSGALLNIVLNFICIPIFGYIAAGYTTLVCYMMFTVAHYCIMKSICKKESINEELFDMKYIVLQSILVLIITILFSFIYESMLIRYIVLLTIALFIFIKRKIFIDSIKSIRLKN